MIRMVQCLCHSRHCVLAVFYEEHDDETRRTAIDKMEAIFDDGTLRRRCGICGCTHLVYEDRATRLTSMLEAAKVAGALYAEQMMSRALLETVHATADSLERAGRL
jgi:hypothetical protein